ncbi:hypothetical protein IQ16_02647 [Bradyrhizobium huanghuaihaiense]|uniref:Uncharacterized protein n=2 Tax=Bradyrhizobium huanghuaihaiense TaxID=990078 RepID=A0A562RSN6_9BRAD|nr:hypothetical protein IQ16_02647 [Bradyrhizobium huanghuaihaiense]
MLGGLRHWLTVRGMRRSERKISKAYAKDIEAAKAAKKPRKDIEYIEESEHHELRFVRDEMEIAETKRLYAQAAHYRLPIPQAEDDWEESAVFGKRYLTRKGAAKLRSDIRAEQKARWDYWQSRLQLVGTVMGIIGGIMGALAYFKQPPLPPHP